MSLVFFQVISVMLLVFVFNSMIWLYVSLPFGIEIQGMCFSMNSYSHQFFFSHKFFFFLKGNLQSKDRWETDILRTITDWDSGEIRGVWMGQAYTGLISCVCDQISPSIY